MLVQEHPGRIAELVGVLGGEVVDAAVSRTLALHLGMAYEIVAQARGHILALSHYAHPGVHIFHNLGHEQGVMGASEYDGIDVGIERHELVDALLYEIVGARAVGLVVLHERHPEGAGHARHADVREELVYLEVVAVALDGALGGQDAHVARLGERANDLGRGPDDAQHAPVGVYARQVVLLYCAQRLGRCRVASQYDEVAPELKQPYHGLARELVDDVERARPVWRARIVAKVKIVVARQQLAYSVQYGKPAVTRVEYAYGAGGGIQFVHVCGSSMPRARLMRAKGSL